MSIDKSLNHIPARGFTIVELLVVAPIIILTIGAFITVIVNMTGDVLASRTSNVLSYNIQEALNTIEEDIKLSTTFLAENNIDLTSPQGYNNDTTKFANVDSDTSKSDMLILSTLATTANPLNSGAYPVYLNNQPNNCTSQPTFVSQNTPMTMNIVYFVKNNALWRRTIAPANYLTVGVACTTPWQVASCAEGQTAAFCKTQDKKLLDSINPAGFMVEYYDSASSQTPSVVASNPTSAVDVRNSALQGIPTASVSIDISQLAAGRTVTQAGSVRATRLDNNASAIAPVVVVTTPTVPTVSVSLSQPSSGVFTWPTVSGATGYSFKYNLTGGDCNSGSWTTAFTNQNTTTFSAEGTHGGRIYGCASATNSAGTSAWSNMASISIPIWATPFLQNNWTNYSTTYNSAGYTKTSSGLVVLKGLIKRSGTFVSGETLFTLPVGYRPSTIMGFAVASVDASATLLINPDGTVTPTTNVSAGWLSLETVSFQPSTYSGTWTNLTLANSWTNSNGTNDPLFSYTQDSTGRVLIRGKIVPGTQTDGTDMHSPGLPVGFRPPLYNHIAIRSGGNGHNAVGVDAGGIIEAKGGSGGTAYYNNFQFIPTSYTGTWTSLTLLNSWVNHTPATYSTAQYTKTSDGMVTIKGLIKSGTVTNGTIIATLPAGFRPTKTVLTDTICSGVVFCRLDIDSSGNIIVRAGVSAVWTSMDNITFLAEQ